jgi:hypothetical protein
MPSLRGILQIPQIPVSAPGRCKTDSPVAQLALDLRSIAQFSHEHRELDCALKERKCEFLRMLLRTPVLTGNVSQVVVELVNYNVRIIEIIEA